MRQHKRYLASLVGFLGLVFVVGACSGGVETARESGRTVASQETERSTELVTVKPEVPENLKVHPSGHVVIPGYVHVKRGQKIKWTNNTGGMILIQIPDERIFGHPLSVLVEDGDSFTSPKVAKEAPDGKYEYTIFMYKNHKHADASSNPGIIIP